MSIMKDDADILVTQFQQQLYAGLGKMISEIAALNHKNDNEVPEDEEDDGSQARCYTRTDIETID